MSNKFKYLTAVLLASPCISLPAAELEEVAVIGTRVPTSVLSLPNNVSVLDSDVLQSISPVHIQQVLSQAPGVNFQRGNGQESLPAIRSAVLTGAGACGSVLVLEQAIPVRGAGFCNVNELFDTHFEQARQIEVVRGANTAFYGSNSLTGSINVSLPSIGADYLSIELGANQYVRGKAAIGYGDSDAGDAHGRLYLTATEDGGYRDESGFHNTNSAGDTGIAWPTGRLMPASRRRDWIRKPLDLLLGGTVIAIHCYADKTWIQKHSEKLLH